MNDRVKPVFKADVLLCEDDAMNRALISSRLAKVDIIPTTAENGKVGLDMVTHRLMNGIKPFDLIFMDINMPVMSGLEAATEIRKLNTGTPVIAITPDCTPSEKEKYLAHGMIDCLKKPFTSQELQNFLIQYIPSACLGDK